MAAATCMAKLFVEFAYTVSESLIFSNLVNHTHTRSRPSHAELHLRYSSRVEAPHTCSRSMAVDIRLVVIAAAI